MHASEAFARALAQWRAVAAVLTGSVIALAEGRSWAAALTASAAMVLLVLSMVAAACRQRERDRAIDAILDGHEHVPLAAIQRQRQRLLSQRTRAALARSIKDTTAEAWNTRVRLRPVTPLFDARVIRTVTDDLDALARSLQTAPTSALGVALVERLLAHACSPLYGPHPQPLREELHRVRSILET